MNVTITLDDINAELLRTGKTWKNIDGKIYPSTFSSTGQLIDELAYSAGQWDSNEVEENNFYGEWEWSGAQETVKTFDYESALLDVLNGDAERRESMLFDLQEALDIHLTIPLEIWEEYEKQSLKFGAFLALKHPGMFDSILVAYTEKCKEEAPQHFDSAFISEYCKELENEIQEALDSYQAEMRSEWLWGDRSSSGVVAAIAKHYGAESADYNDKYPNSDIFTFNFENEEALHSEYCSEYFDECTSKADHDYKAYLLSDIVSQSNNIFEKKRRESEKRKEERERLAAYKKSQADEKEAERVAKLKSMKK